MIKNIKDGAEKTALDSIGSRFRALSVQGFRKRYADLYQLGAHNSPESHFWQVGPETGEAPSLVVRITYAAACKKTILDCILSPSGNQAGSATGGVLI